MNNKLLENLMENFNLDEKEAKVYLASLERGLSPASKVAEQAGLNRVTTYEVLKRLIRRGIISTVTYGQIQRFRAIEPEKFLDKEKMKIERAKKSLVDFSCLLSGVNSKPKVTFFEHVEGMRSVYSDTLTVKDKVIYNIAHAENLMGAIGSQFLQGYIHKRVQKNILVKVLLPDTPAMRQYEKEVKTSQREVKFFDANKFTVPNEILIYDHKLSLLSFQSKIGVIIEDKDITQSVKALWQMVWGALH